jgi:hypothetical protein
MTTHNYFPPYSADENAVAEGDLVELASGKKFVYAISTTGYPGRYRSFSPRQEIIISGMEFDGVLPILVSDPSENTVDGTTTMEVTTSINIQTLEEVTASIDIQTIEDEN